MEDEILSPRLRDFLSKNQGEIREPFSINQEDPPRWEGSNSNCAYFFLIPLHIFVDLIIGEVACTPSPDRHFLQVYTSLLMPRRLDDQGNNNWRRLWEANRKSRL